MAGTKQSRNSQFSKTKMCRFEILGMCTKGQQCPFAHGATELKPLPDLRCTKLCRELLQFGECHNKNCTYAHSREELRTATEKAAAAGRLTRHRGGGEVSEVNNSAEASVPVGESMHLQRQQQHCQGTAAMAAALAVGGCGSRPGAASATVAVAAPATTTTTGAATARHPGRPGAGIRPKVPTMAPAGDPAYVPLRFAGGPSAASPINSATAAGSTGFSGVGSGTEAGTFSLINSLGLGSSQGALTGGTAGAMSEADADVAAALNWKEALEGMEALMGAWGAWGGGNAWTHWGGWSGQVGGLSPGPATVQTAAADEPWRQVGQVLNDPACSTANAALRAVRQIPSLSSESTLCTLGDEWA